MAHMDTDGFIYFIGRKTDNLRYKKFSEVIYPGVIENVARSHPSVGDAQVI